MANKVLGIPFNQVKTNGVNLLSFGVGRVAGIKVNELMDKGINVAATKVQGLTGITLTENMANYLKALGFVVLGGVLVKQTSKIKDPNTRRMGVYAAVGLASPALDLVSKSIFQKNLISLAGVGLGEQYTPAIEETVETTDYSGAEMGEFGEYEDAVLVN